MCMTSGSQVQKRRARRRMSVPHPPSTSTSILACNPLPHSLAHLDLSTASPAPILASIRLLVLNHLAELEKTLAYFDIPAAETAKLKGEDAIEDARAWAMQGLDMLGRIRNDVCSHLPDLPSDPAIVEVLFGNQLHDYSYAIMDDIKSALPSLHMPDVQSRLQGVRSHLPEVQLDLHQPMKYLPTLSHHLQSLHTHLSSMKAMHGYSRPSFPSTRSVMILLDKLLSSDLVHAVQHRVDERRNTFGKAANKLSVALKKSLDGSRLVTYVDLPLEWRNNPFVNRGYRFIPLTRWHVILLSLFAIHNETLNIHTHMIPLLHSAMRFIHSTHFSSSPIDRPEQIYTIFAMICLFSSVLWHTMSGCAHQKGMELCARVDYVGIGWLISASVGSLVYYGLSCHDNIVTFYLSLCLLMGACGSIFPFTNWFNDRAHKKLRITFFVSMAFTGVAPIAHLAYVFGSRDTLSFIGPLIPSLAAYVIGLIFYVTHIPERFAYYNERISYWTDWLGGGSHAIWHAFIVLAIYQHKRAMREFRWGIGGEACRL